MRYDRPMRENDDGSITEIPLSHCSNGHRLGPGRVGIGWINCSCAGGNGHRTYRCTECTVIEHVPPHTREGGSEVGSGYFKG